MLRVSLERKLEEEYGLKIRSRATIVVTIILALSMISVPGLTGSQMGLGVAQGLPDSLYPIVVSMGDTERVFFATHTSSKVDGNWIELNGGTTVELPSLSFVYDGPDIDYDKGGFTVKMDSSFIQGLTYPLSTHRVYKAGDSVSATFWGSPDLDKSVSFKLLKASSFKEIYDDVLNGDVLGIMLTLLDLEEWSQKVTLDSSGDATHSFTAPAAGD